MRTALNRLAINGTVVIGEGERDKAPMLHSGEQVGIRKGSVPRVDIALDPLEGTAMTAKGGPHALSVMAMAGPGNLLRAPDLYMQKIAAGQGLPEGIIDLDASVADNLNALATARDAAVKDLIVCILDRPRHHELVADVRQTGARIVLIPDGDVSAVMATAGIANPIDIYMGIGGAPEGVLAAAALHCLGGFMQGRLIFCNETEKAHARAQGIENLDRKYKISDLACGDVIFAATGVTDGAMLRGVHCEERKAHTHSIVMCSHNDTIRMIQSTYGLDHPSAPRI